MRKPLCFLWISAILLAGCDAPRTGGRAADNGFIAELPEGVLAIAAPYQNLSAVKIDETTGCYLYRYVGPVETTFLPLRSTTGRPICSRPQETPATATG